MDIQKEKELYLAELLERGALKQDEIDDLDFKTEISAFHSSYLSARFIDNINFGWSAWQAAKAQAVPNLHHEILVESIIEHVDSHLEANSFVVGDSFDRGWKAAMQCVRNNITMVSKRKDLANAKK